MTLCSQRVKPRLSAPLELCLQQAGFGFTVEGEGEDTVYRDTKTGNVIVNIDPRYYRPAEVDLLIGDPSKAKNDLGCEAKTTLEELAKLMLEADCTRFGVQV